MGEICSIKGRIGFRGYTRRDIISNNDGAISLSPSNIVDNNLRFEDCTFITWDKYYESPEIIASVNDIVFTKTASVGKLAIIKCLPHAATINPQLVLLKEIKCTPKYLYYYMTTEKFQSDVRVITGVGSVPNVPQSSLSRIEIPILPLAEQERIVSILDRFEALTTDLTSGLPAEINARQQQYEYYRDTLLSFPRKASNS